MLSLSKHGTQAGRLNATQFARDNKRRALAILSSRRGAASAEERGIQVEIPTSPLQPGSLLRETPSHSLLALAGG
jgi:hypothetical protein